MNGAAFGTGLMTLICIYGDCYVILGFITLRACLHGGGGPQVGEVSRLAVVEKWLAFICKLTIPGSRGDVTRR